MNERSGLDKTGQSLGFLSNVSDVNEMSRIGSEYHLDWTDSGGSCFGNDRAVNVVVSDNFQYSQTGRLSQGEKLGKYLDMLKSTFPSA